MKKFVVFIVFICTAIPAFSQISPLYFYEPNDYFMYGMYYNSYNSRLMDDVKEHGIKEYRVFKEYYKDNKVKKPKYLSTEYLFDPNGNKTSYKYYYKKDKILYSRDFSYNDSNKVTEIILKNKKEEIKRKYNYEYTSFNEMLSYKKYGKHGEKLKRSEQRKYNNDQKMIERASFRNGDKLISKFTYSYYPNGDRKETRMFNGKNKLNKVWSYACNDEGEEVTKHKDTVEVCVWEEHKNDGYLYKTSRYTDEKGRITKNVSKYTKDSVLVETIYYNKNNELSYKKIYHTKYNDFYEYTRYKKGKVTRKNSSKYNTDDKIVFSEFWRKGKFRYKYVYTYDENNNCTSRTYFRKDKTNFKNKIDYTYNDKNLIIESSSFDKKNRLTKKQYYSYKYY